ncbi:MAG TPA: hypothetical protein VFJ74_08620, partial [Gemmatimonadaceae bacterium]|nr:hypothetical protein [Gemmatimonadaceae bacterium]
SISDEAICRQAAVAFEQSIASGTGVAFDPAGVGPVYVVRTPDRYVVHAPHRKAGEFSVSLVFDYSFNELAGFAY